MAFTRGVALGALATVVVIAVGALAWVAVRPGTATTTPSSPASTRLPSESSGRPQSAAQLGQDFLTDWVTDGRVIRRDQGGDTVSEGQAYGMLIAVGIGDENSFDAIWSWTRTHLMRDDGLLAWRWDDGRVADDMPAADADLDAARALVLAGARFDRPSLTRAGNELGSHILDRMTAETVDGRILLPGPWAATASPLAYNPSYASPVAYTVLAKSSGDPRWSELEVGSRATTAALLAKTALPPDWAQVHADTGSVDDMPGPAGTGTDVRYSFDASRLPLRYAESCNTRDRGLAAGMSTTLGTSRRLAASLDLGGRSIGDTKSPVAYAGRAAAHAAAGQTAAARSDLAAATRLSQSTPTYFGAAWAALAPLMLETSQLGGCPLLKEVTP